MVLSIIKHHPKPNYYNHAPTLFRNISIFLLFPLLVNGQYFDRHRPDEQSTNPLYLGMAFATATIVIVVIFVAVNLYCKNNPAARVRAHDGPARRASVGLDPLVVESFPVFKYSEVAAHRADTGLLECAVCLSPFEVDDDENKLRLLPKCNHVFHVCCVDPWLKDHSTCPLCRANLVPEPNELVVPVSSRVAEPVSDAVVEVNEVGNDSNVVEVRRDIEEGFNGRYKRWKSTGHVAEVKQVDEDDWKRFTLKLPEEKMKKLGEKTGKFKRTRSSF